jgi:hypothetical protein
MLLAKTYFSVVSLQQWTFLALLQSRFTSVVSDVKHDYDGCTIMTYFKSCGHPTKLEIHEM